MPTKVVKTTVKVQLAAGEASPAPPLGPILGQHGVPIMDFVKAYNERTADKKGQVLPALITIYEDRSFDFEIKTAPVADLIKKTINLQKGSGEPNKNKVGKLTRQQLEDIAKEKFDDLNANDIDAAMKIVAGTARSMGVEVEL